MITLSDNDLASIKTVALRCEVNIVAIELMGNVRIYYCPDIRLKTRDCPYNELFDAKDITVLILNKGINFANGMTNAMLMELMQSINKESFKFGHDNYVLFTKVEVNK